MTRGLVAAFVLTVGVTGCASDPVRDTVDRLSEATTPPIGWASTLIYAREPAAVNASWEVETNMSWERYVEFVQLGLARVAFTASETQNAGALFRRELEGDVQVLQLRPISNAASGRVGVTFTSRPF